MLYQPMPKDTFREEVFVSTEIPWIKKARQKQAHDTLLLLYLELVTWRHLSNIDTGFCSTSAD
jgi:hypothetical protein